METAIENLERNASVQKKLFERIGEVVEAEFIFLSPGIPAARNLTIIIDREQETVPASIVTGIREIYEKFPGINYRIYTVTYAYDQLEEGNLYFIRNCLCGKLIYRRQDSKIPDKLSKVCTTEAINKSRNWFRAEMEKIGDFKEGAYFYKKSKKRNQAAYLIHQTIELLYRCMEHFAMGKSKCCHKISNHLEYAHPFIHGAGRLFKANDRVEEQLLALLDKAYCDSRYTNSYDITRQEVKVLLRRAEIMENQVKEIFEFRLADCNEHQERDLQQQQVENGPIQPSAIREAGYHEKGKLRQAIDSFCRNWRW